MEIVMTALAAEPQATRREWIGLAIIALPCMLYSMDLTVLNLAVPQLSADLAPSASQLLWIVDIYGFMIAGSLITMGTLGDRIGRRRLLLIGAVAFGLASVLAAFSTSAEMLIAARAMLGVAGATLAPSTLSLIRNMFLDPRQRTVAISVWITSFSVGGALGPLIGGILLQFFWWGSVFLVAVPLWAWTHVNKVDASPGDKGRPGDQPGTTYLLVGSDSRQGLSKEQREELGTGNAGGQRTDTIMLLHIGDGPNLLMSIPRDSIVSIPGHGDGLKVNAAYAYGGPKLLTRTLENETGIRIDDYVEIGFGGFVGMVDAVGGVEICPTTAMKDPQANLDIAKGCQEADGPTALGYARSRKTSGLGDIDRAKHQREVVSAIGSKALSPWTFINPVRYYRLSMASAESFTVGEETGPVALGRFAFAMTRVNGENGLTCGVPIADLAVNWDQERSARLFRHIIEDDTAGIPKNLCTPTGMPPQ
jgi:LCP family protein required for cell wall assembly